MTALRGSHLREAGYHRDRAHAERKWCEPTEWARTNLKVKGHSLYVGRPDALSHSQFATDEVVPYLPGLSSQERSRGEPQSEAQLGAEEQAAHELQAVDEGQAVHELQTAYELQTAHEQPCSHWSG